MSKCPLVKLTVDFEGPTFAFLPAPLLLMDLTCHFLLCWGVLVFSSGFLGVTRGTLTCTSSSSSSLLSSISYTMGKKRNCIKDEKTNRKFQKSKCPHAYTSNLEWVLRVPVSLSSKPFSPLWIEHEPFSFGGC